MKKIIALLFSVLLIAALCFSASATSSKQPRLMDDADLLTADQEAEITEKLDEISERQKFDVVIHTTYDTDGKSLKSYADDYFDYNGYGFGSNYDGCILVIDMIRGDWWISGCGRGEENIDDTVIDSMSEEIKPYLVDEDYYTAMDTFADLCDENCNGPGYNWFFGIVFSLVVGFGIALIAVMVMKGKLKSVHRQPAAKDYLVPGSMNVTMSRDIFLYRNVTRRAKPKENSGSHTSSSGRSHSGGGGSFR